MKVDADELKLMFQEVDEDGSGEVDLDEYLGMLKQVKEGGNRRLQENWLKQQSGGKMKRKQEAVGGLLVLERLLDELQFLQNSKRNN